MASDRLLPVNAALKQLLEIVITKSSTHEITIKLNKAIILIKQKQLDEAKKLLKEISGVDDIMKVKDERILELYAHIYEL